MDEAKLNELRGYKAKLKEDCSEKAQKLMADLKDQKKSREDFFRLVEKYNKRMSAEALQYKLATIIETFDSMYLDHLPNNLSLSDDNLSILHERLISKQYIAKDTPKDVFIWIMGGTERPTSLINLEEITALALRSGFDGIDFFDAKSFFQNKLKSQRIKWIKYTSTTKEYHINKKSLLDLLCLLKVPEELLLFKHYCPIFFVDKNNNELEFNRENYRGFESSRRKSEYHNELIEIVSFL